VIEKVPEALRDPAGHRHRATGVQGLSRRAGFRPLAAFVLAKLEESTKLPPGPTGLQPVPEMLVLMSRAPVVSISLIRGRATGVGIELAPASDMRFISREKAVLSQWEVGAGLVPDGGPMAGLPRLIGRGRALELLLGADAMSGELAERYGYVSRALPDASRTSRPSCLRPRLACDSTTGLSLSPVVPGR
jgi:enoyl-CoA hydratase/carnithine racemase